MRLYETTAIVKQNDDCIPRQYAHREYGKKTMRWLALLLVLIGVIGGLGSMKENLLAGLLFMGLMALSALISLPVGAVMMKKAAAQMHPGGDGEWSCITWFENDGIHRLDDDGDEVVVPLGKLICAYRAGNVLLLCTKTQTVVAINLAQLSETDRKSVFERIKTDCPKLKMVQVK